MEEEIQLEEGADELHVEGVLEFDLGEFEMRRTDQ